MLPFDLKMKRRLAACFVILWKTREILQKHIVYFPVAEHNFPEREAFFLERGNKEWRD
jgi:hypothetical protein